MGALIGIPINPDLSEWLFITGKHLFILVWHRYKAMLYAVPSTPGEQYRQHIRCGGYRP